MTGINLGDAHKEDELVFVLAKEKGRLDVGGIKLVRSHAMQYVGKKKKEQNVPSKPRRRNRPGNIFFGAKFDSLAVLPQFSAENRKPGALDGIKNHMFQTWTQDGMVKFVWPSGIKDPSFFCGLMLLASTHHDALRMGKLSTTTTGIRSDALRIVRENMQDPVSACSIGNISAIAVLAATAFVYGGSAEYIAHRNAMWTLAAQRRETHTEENLMSWNVFKVIKMFSIGRVCNIPVPGVSMGSHDSPPTLASFASFFETREKSQQIPDPRLFSPLYHPGNSSDVRFPRVTNPNLQDLLCQSRRLVYLLVCDQPQYGQAAKLLACVTEKHLTRVTERQRGKQDGIYRSCLLTVMVMVRAHQSSVTMAEAAQTTALIKEVKSSLLCTNIGALWEEKIGLLYWIVLVYHCASFGTPEHLFFHGIYNRLIFQLTYDYPDWKGAVIPMLELRKLMAQA